MSAIPAHKILDLLADGLNIDEIVDQNPPLSRKDILGTIRKAADRLRPRKFEDLAVYTDGASKGNPGPAGAGVIIYKGDEIIDRISQSLGEATNNIAEYKAVILGLKKAAELKAKRVALFSDSELLVKQMNGHYRIKNKGLRDLSLEVNCLRKKFEMFTITYIPREENKEADLLAEQAITDYRLTI